MTDPATTLSPFFADLHHRMSTGAITPGEVAEALDVTPRRAARMIKNMTARAAAAATD